ncbi:Nucleolar protein 9, partial [Coemansia sp. RSA 2618]
MGGDGKRKTRRGKRGGESKRTKDDKEPTDPKSTADEVYTAPPMDNNDSLFFIDTGASHTNNNNNDDDDDMAVDQEDKISPASYGLVNPDLQSYLKNCEAMLDSPTFESAEMQIMFVNNVYAEMKGFELQLTTDHEGSRILEKLFRISSAFQIRRFFALTREDAIRLAIHRFSSHTIQTLLLLSA